MESFTSIVDIDTADVVKPQLSPKQLQDKITLLEQENSQLKERLKKYTNPERQKKYKEKNREKILEYAKEYQKAHYQKRK